MDRAPGIPIANDDADTHEEQRWPTSRNVPTADGERATCGLRWSELAGLTADNVDLMRRRLEIARAVTEVNGGVLAWNTPKNHERRSVPIPRFLIDELATALHGRQRDDLVFTTAAESRLA